MNYKKLFHHTIRTFFACGGCAIGAGWLCPMPAAAKIIFVDNRLDRDYASGNYNIAKRNGFGLDGMAYRTIQQALNNAAAADSIYIRAGIYREAVEITASGEANKYFMLRNYPGEQAILDGNKTLPAKDLGLIFLSGKSRIKIIGLTLINSRCYGLQAVNCSELIVQECEAAFSNHGGIVCEGGSQITIDGCRVHHNNDLGLSAWHEAVTMSGVNIFEVANCEVYANKEEGIDAKYGATNGLIHHNRVYDNNGPNIYIDAAHHLEIYSNRVYGASGAKAGIMLGVENHESRYDTHDVKIYNNLIYKNAGGIAFWLDRPAHLYGEFYNVQIVNNFFHANNKNNWGGIYLQNGGPGNYGGGLVIRNNVFWENTAAKGAQTIRDEAGVLNKFNIDYNLFKSGEPSETFGAAAVTIHEVKCVDLLKHDYRLHSDSPARDAGSPLGAPLKDFDGNPRPFGAAYDLGPYEFSNKDTAQQK